MTGSGTFHASQYVAIRRKGQREPKMDIQIKSDGRSKVLHVQSEITNLQEANMSTSKPEPVFSKPVLQSWYLLDDQKIKKRPTYGTLHGSKPCSINTMIRLFQAGVVSTRKCPQLIRQ